MWNDLSLQNPVQDICEYGKKDASLLEDLPNLITELTTAAECMTEEHPVWDEIQILGNIQAKYKRILHCDKCLQLLQRVGVCLRKMVLLNLSKVYLDLGEKLLRELQTANAQSAYFLPSRQQLEFVLIRTQTAAKLICESLHYSREAFCFLIQRLKVGHLILNLMMATSVTARLNIVFKGLLLQIFHIYKNLQKWRNRLKSGGWEWPKPLDLPEDLETWLIEEDSNHLRPKHLPQDQLDLLTRIFEESKEDNAAGPEAADDVDDVVFLNNDTSDKSMNEVESEKEYIDIEDDNGEADFDVGVSISRSEVEKDDSYMASNNSNVGEAETSEICDEETHSLNGEESGKKEKLSVLEEFIGSADFKALPKARRKLLKIIAKAVTLKELKMVWDSLDVTSQDLLPKGLTPENIRKVDKVFLKTKQQISEIKNSNVTTSKKKKKKRLLLKETSVCFATLIKLLPVQETDSRLQPIHTFQELKALYEFLSQKLQDEQKYKKFYKLKRQFKNRKEDIKLLIESGDKHSAKRLIGTTFKLFRLKFS